MGVWSPCLGSKCSDEQLLRLTFSAPGESGYFRNHRGGPWVGLGWHGTGKRSLTPAPAWPQVRPTTQGFQQVLLRGLWVVPQQRIQGHHHPRGAEAALGPVALGNPLLEGHRRGHRPWLPTATSAPQGPCQASPLAQWHLLPEQSTFTLSRVGQHPQGRGPRNHVLALQLLLRLKYPDPSHWELSVHNLYSQSENSPEISNDKECVCNFKNSFVKHLHIFPSLVLSRGHLFLSNWETLHYGPFITLFSKFFCVDQKELYFQRSKILVCILGPGYLKHSLWTGSVVLGPTRGFVGNVEPQVSVLNLLN